MPIGDNVRHYIGYRYQRPDAESFSPQETAGGIAKIIVGYNKKIDVMKSGSKNDVLMVSHDFVLSAFLQEVLGIELQESKKNMNPAESFEVIINTDSSGKHVLDCVYEGKRYSIPPDLLNSFAQKYEAAKEQN